MAHGTDFFPFQSWATASSSSSVPWRKKKYVAMTHSHGSPKNTQDWSYIQWETVHVGGSSLFSSHMQVEWIMINGFVHVQSMNWRGFVLPWSGRSLSINAAHAPSEMFAHFSGDKPFSTVCTHKFHIPETYQMREGPFRCPAAVQWNGPAVGQCRHRWNFWHICLSGILALKLLGIFEGQLVKHQGLFWHLSIQQIVPDLWAHVLAENWLWGHAHTEPV